MAVQKRVVELEAALARAHAERDELLRDVENLCMQASFSPFARHTCQLRVCRSQPMCLCVRRCTLHSSACMQAMCLVG